MDIIIEITRDCNLKCEHCLRGKKEDKAIQRQDVESLFSRIREIDNLTLTGGEPALRPDKIEMILDIAKFYEVEIYNFYMATNGTIASDGFLLVLLKLWNYCSENEISCVDISNDTFHNIELIQKEKLSALSFVNYKFYPKIIDPFSENQTNLRNNFNFPTFEYDYNNFDADFLINQGRGKDWGDKDPSFVASLDKIEEEDLNDIEFYLNINGDIINGCDWSYKTQDEYKICHVSEFGKFLKKHEKI